MDEPTENDKMVAAVGVCSGYLQRGCPNIEDLKPFLDDLPLPVRYAYTKEIIYQIQMYTDMELRIMKHMEEYEKTHSKNEGE